MKKFFSILIVLCMLISIFSVSALACTNCTNSYPYSATGKIISTNETYYGTPMYACCSGSGLIDRISAGSNVIINRGVNYADVNGNIVGWYNVTYNGVSGWIKSSHVRVINSEYSLNNE